MLYFYDSSIYYFNNDNKEVKTLLLVSVSNVSHMSCKEFYLWLVTQLFLVGPKHLCGHENACC